CNCLTLMKFALVVLKVKRILVGGFYGCGGVLSGLTRARLGLVVNWIRHVPDAAEQHNPYLQTLGALPDQHARLCVLNVL
ncbi:carbonic anhydrase, partial [Xylella fastidiosa subsp. multiplex]|uniref:carbonic anhydrase n=1 Tax=Xylella fastidiosa TaxID=2371 RepID=UPI0013261C36